MWRWVCLALCLGLTGCQPAQAPAQPPPTPTAPAGPPTQAPTPAVLARVSAAPPTPTLAPTPRPTLAPTATPQPQPSPTPVPTATADPARAAQQQYCDTAVPPARIPLPPLVPAVHIPQPVAATRPTPSTSGPRREGSDPPPQVTAPHVAVLDDGSGSLLYAQDAFAREAPASITKIATAIVALEHQPDLSRMVTTSVSSSALLACDGSSVMGLEPDDHVSIETLLYGMLLPSGNDAAEQLAVSLAGSRERFVDWMNDKVLELKLADTHFVTPSGMDADDHYSSAYDMALLARSAMQHAEFRTIVATQRFVGNDYYMHNLNPLLGTYPGTDGVKIGYTDIAGHTIVASATRDGHRVYVSLLGSQNLVADCTALFDWVWQTYRW